MKAGLLKPFFLAIMVLALVPFGSPDFKLDNLGDLNVDVAYKLALPYFLNQHLQFGEQIVFTYGPWGILKTGVTGASWHVVFLLFRILLVIGVFLGLYIFVDRCSGRAGRAVAWGGATILLFMWVTGQSDSYFLFPTLLVAFQYMSVSLSANESDVMPVRQWEPLLWIILTALSGWLALVKFTIFIVACVAYLLILVVDVRRKRWPVLPVTYSIALLLAWIYARQNLSNFPLWVSRSLDLSFGYSDAMAKGFFAPYNLWVVAFYYAGVMLIALTTFAAVARYRRKFSGILMLLFMLFLCAISITHGMGGNQIEQSLALLFALLWLVSLWLVVPATQELGVGQYLSKRFGITSALLGLLCLAIVAANVNFPINSPKLALEKMLGNVSQLTHLLRGDSTDHWDVILAKAHRFWQPPTIPKDQTIDVYPQHTGIVIQREGLLYSPRPAFLSLNAHTYKLAMLNARHLEGKAAPDFILFQMLPKDRAVNNRYPALADGPSWPLLLSNYAPENTDEEFILLKKRLSPLRFTRQLLLEANLKFGEVFQLPQSDGKLIWAELEVKRSPVGDIIHALYKSPHVLMKSRTADNSMRVFQIVPELGKAGFFISPLVQNNMEFRDLYRRRVDRVNTVKSIVIISPESPRIFWKKTFKIRIYTLGLNSTSNDGD